MILPASPEPDPRLDALAHAAEQVARELININQCDHAPPDVPAPPGGRETHERALRHWLAVIDKIGDERGEDA